MEIKIILEEKKLLSTKYIKLVSRKDFDKILIRKNDIKYADLQFGDILSKDLLIRVSFKSFKSEYIFNVSDILFKTQEITLIGNLFDPLYLYEQGYIDNFKLLTDKKEKVDWYELNNKQKYYYLRGCCLLNGVRETIDNINLIITIDLSKARTDLDVYYEIGKVFFKSYGYFGTEFHSFRDCLISIDESMKKRDEMPILKIKGYLNFRKYFENNILYDDFYQEFTKSGFEIQNLK